MSTPFDHAQQASDQNYSFSDVVCSKLMKVLIVIMGVPGPICLTTSCPIVPTLATPKTQMADTQASINRNTPTETNILAHDHST